MFAPPGSRGRFAAAFTRATGDLLGMMSRALLVVGFLATLGFVATGVLGYRVGGDGESFQMHLLLGLVSSLLLLFSHCWIMFYLIGTGKAIKDAVAEHGLEAEIVSRTKRFKADTFGWMMLAMGLAMAAFILGGGVYTGAVPKWVHHGLFYLALAAQAWTLMRETRALAANDRLMAEINQRLEAA
jgi:hypothetical protein